MGSWPSTHSLLEGSVAPTACPALSHTEREAGPPLSTQKGRAGGRARGHRPAVKAYLEHERRGFLPPSLALLCGPTTGLSTRLPLSTPPRPPFHLPSQSISQRQPEVLLGRQDSRGARDRAGSTSRLSPGAHASGHHPVLPPPTVSGPVPMPQCSRAQRKK